MKKWIVLAVLVIAAAGGGVMFYRSKPAEASSTLITAPITRGNVVDTVQSTGTLEAVTTVQVGTQVSGAIKALHADFNSMVHVGEVVAELEPSLFETQVEQAKATLVRLQADLDRAKVQVEDAQLKLNRATELSSRNLIPKSELETAQSTFRQAQSAVKSAEAQIVQARASLNQSQVNLDNTIIKAPIDGVVVSRNVDVGQTVAASMQAPTLFIIAKDMTQMQVSASIDESDIGRIQPGQTVTFRVDAYPDEQFTGSVRQVRLQPVVQQNVVSYTTIISVPNPNLKLKPGMTATVTVEIARADNVLRLPTAALRFRPTAEVFASLNQDVPPGLDGQGRGRGQAGAKAAAAPAAPVEAPRPVLRPVWLLTNGKLERVALRIGISDGAATAILDGPVKEDAVVVTGVAQAQSAQQGGANPLFGGRGGFGGPGGFGGGGRGGFPGGSGARGGR